MPSERPTYGDISQRMVDWAASDMLRRAPKLSIRLKRPWWRRAWEWLCEAARPLLDDDFDPFPPKGEDDAH